MTTDLKTLITTTIETVTTNHEQAAVVAVVVALIVWTLRKPLFNSTTSAVVVDAVKRLSLKLAHLLLSLLGAGLWHAIVRVVAAGILFIAAKYYGWPI